MAVIAALKAGTNTGPRVRFIIHFGSVAIGGVSAVREETLMGSEVNLVFRLEKLLASLGEPCGISDAAQTKLQELLPSRPLGDYELKGFEEEKQLVRRLGCIRRNFTTAIRTNPRNRHLRIAVALPSAAYAL